MGVDKVEDIVKKVYYSEVDTEIGILTVAKTDNGVCWINFGSNEDTLYQLKAWTKRWLNTDQLTKSDNELSEVKNQLIDYFTGKRKVFDLSLDIYGTSFQKLVWENLLNIPYGEVRSYKDIAAIINSPKSVRAVGGANQNNPLPIIMPCHRVIGSNGNLVGYAGGIDVKRSLLELEGYIK